MSLLCADIFSNILFIIVAIVVLLTMVLIHELGHYVAGRILGFKITEFSIGFGKAIFQRKNKRGEIISLRVFPLGGFCAFEGEDDDDDYEQPKKDKKKSKVKNEQIAEPEVKEEVVAQTEESVSEVEKVYEKIEKLENQKEENATPQKAEEPKKKEYNPNAFINQKPWKRIIVYSAGVFFNFLSVIVFSFILLLSYGYDIQEVASLDTKYSYLYGDLQKGDVIWKVDGVDVNFSTNGTLPTLLQNAGADKDIELTIERQGEMQTLVIRLAKEEYKTESGETATKLVSGFQTKGHAFGFFEALGRCFVLAIGFVWVILKGFWQIISGQVAISQLGGPISTIGMISNISQQGFANFLVLLPLLSANLAVFNFLPFPALDGAHVVFTTIEWIRGKPINRKIENYIHFFGLVILLAFVVIIDIVHLIVA
ncbi:MAG: site-2 protease family protein [Clostridia bacterium]|nr:site-2 protease family protein [Clostridia bacterium]